MRNDAITKSYEGLTNTERASLAFSYLTQGDELELTRLTDSAPRVSLRGLHPEYMETFERLFTAASWWSIEYWRTQAHYLGCLHVVEDSDHKPEMVDVAKGWQAKLYALDVVLDEIGPAYGLDPASVRRMASIDPDRISPNNPAPYKGMAGIESFFRALLTGADAPQ